MLIRVERSMENREEEGSSSETKRRSKKGKELLCMVDRTSELPDVLLQHIQSFLPVPEATRTSILSKTWLHAWSTYPFLEFNPLHLLRGSSTPPRGDGEARRSLINTTEESPNGEFIEYVNKTLARYRHQQTAVQRLKLTVKIPDSEFAYRVEDWIKTGIEIGTVKLCVCMHFYDSVMSIPESMLQLLLSAKQLISLGIIWEVENNLPRLIPCDTINCHSLRYLLLYKLQIDDRNLVYLFSCCPLIEELTLSFCTGFNKVHVVHLHHLGELKVFVEGNVVIEVEASNLKKISLNWKGNKPAVFYIKPSQNLKFLTLNGSNVTDTSLKNLTLDFPNLEALNLRCSPMLERMDVSTHSLKRLDLAECSNLAEVKIDAPSLGYFHYEGCIPLPPFTFCKFTDPTERKISIYPRPHYVDNSFLLDLRDFALKEKLSRVNVSLWKSPTDHVTDLEELTGEVLPLSPDLETEELSLVDLIQPLANFHKLVKGLLWICQPKYFSVASFRYHSNLKNDISEVLSANRMNPTCCTSDRVKCWRHYLSEVEIQSVEKQQMDGSRFLWRFKLRRSKSSLGNN